nr:hypothetical protein [Mycobacterium haemophilum]
MPGTRSATDAANTVNTAVRPVEDPLPARYGFAEANQAVPSDPARQRIRLVD